MRRVYAHLTHISLDPGVQLNTGWQNRPQQPDGAFHNFLEVDGAQLLLLRLGEQQYLSDQITGARTGLDDFIQTFNGRVVGGQIHTGQARITQYGSQDIIEIMGDTVGQRAQSLHSLPPVQLRLKPTLHLRTALALGNVGHHGDGAVIAPGAIHSRAGGNQGIDACAVLVQPGDFILHRATLPAQRQLFLQRSPIRFV